MKSKLDLEIVIKKLDDFALNYDLEIKEGYSTFIFGKLNEEGFTNAEFVSAIDKIMRENTTTFNKMPNLAMFLENSTKKPLDTETIAHDKASQVFSWLSSSVGFWTDDWGDGKEHLSEKQEYWYKFEEDLQYVVDREFGSTRGLIEAYSEQKLAGSTSWFRKELNEAFKINYLLGNNLAIEGEKCKQLETSDIVKTLGKKLKVK
jgi:hypothetical protein